MTFTLPNERVALKLNRKALSTELANAIALYEFALNLFSHKTLNYRDMPGVDRNVLWVTSGLFTKACRMYRSVYLQLLHGLVPEVEVSLRCLYETTLTLAFLLKPRITIPRNHRNVSPVPGKPLTTVFRSRMYQAHVVFDALRRIHEFQTTPGHVRFGKLFDNPRIEAMAKEAEQELGPVWAKRLRDNRNCFGMRIKTVTELVGQADVYMSAYYFMSRVAHARDALDYLVKGSRPDEVLLNFEADTKNTGRVSGVADTLMFDCANIVNRRYRLGQQKELQRLFGILRLKERARELNV